MARAGLEGYIAGAGDRLYINEIAFNGRLSGRPLGPGSYRLILTPATAGVTSPARSVTFTIRG